MTRALAARLVEVRLEREQALERGVGTVALVLVHVAVFLAGDLAGLLVHDAAHDLHRRDLFLEEAVLLGPRGALLAHQGVLVLHLAGDVVALGHHLRGVAHHHVDAGLLLLHPRVRIAVALHHADRLEAAADRRVRAAQDDLVRGHRDGLQPRRAEAVDRRARDRDRQAGPDQRHARHVAALRAVGLGAAHDHVLDLGDVELRGLAEDVLDAVGGQVIRAGDVERPAMGLGERGAGAGDDDSLSHGGSFLRGKAGGSIPQRCAVGTHAVVRPPTVSWRMCSPRTVVAGGPPRRWPQRRWKSHQRGIPVAVRAGPHREADHRPDLREQPPAFRGGERAGAALGGDARLVEHLVRDPVADAGREGLVEQHRLDRRLPLAQHRVEARGCGQRAPGVEAERADRRLGGRVLAQPDAAEAPAVGQGQLAAAREAQVELGEARRPVGPIDTTVGDEADRAARRQVDAAGHAEVQARPRAAVELEPQVLAVPSHRLHPPADQGAPERGRARRPRRRSGRPRRAPRLFDGRSRPCGRRGAPPRPLEAQAWRQLGHDRRAGAQPSPSWGAAPPSITMVSPFMNEDAADARKMQG